MTASTPAALPWRRDLAAVAPDLAHWVTHEFGSRADLGACSTPDNGMANETILFTVGSDRYVARLAPHHAMPYPTFPVFDLQLQRYCMELVKARTDVPVPEVVGYVEDSRWLGTPFLVMRHVDGEIPRDSPPYVIEGWMTSASPAELERLQESTVEVLAGIHTVRDPADLAPLVDDNGVSPLRRQLTAQQEYYEWARDGRRAPTIEHGLAVLDRTLPANRRTVLNWGDSRIGNIIYRDWRPVAVLDWEMATAGPPEVDVAWLLFMHIFMQDMVTRHGMPGLAGLLEPDRVLDQYEGFSGKRLEDLAWYIAFAGVRFAIILVRMGLRAAAFSELPAGEDPDAIFLFAPLLQRLLSQLGG
jgi:aminoglycoside phosphotransferase (APT) family kinase protein